MSYEPGDSHKRWSSNCAQRMAYSAWRTEEGSSYASKAYSAASATALATAGATSELKTLGMM